LVDIAIPLHVHYSEPVDPMQIQDWLEQYAKEHHGGKIPNPYKFGIGK
jgi:hypothetical protein